MLLRGTARGFAAPQRRQRRLAHSTASATGVQTGEGVFRIPKSRIVDYTDYLDLANPLRVHDRQWHVGEVGFTIVLQLIRRERFGKTQTMGDLNWLMSTIS